MSKNRLHVRLGARLRAVRRDARTTQGALADVVGCSLPSITQAENGSGGSALFIRLARALGYELVGRSFGRQVTVGHGLTALRRDLGLSQRVVANLANVSVPTVAAVERGANSHFSNLADVSVVVGAGLELRLAGEEGPSRDEAETSSTQVTWTTPGCFLDKLYPVIGGAFTLDPCSPTTDGRTAPVRAKVYFTALEDGLSLDWFGQVFCNPPYGRSISAWVAKCRNAVEGGQAELVFALVPARVDTRWWHADVAGRADIYMLKGRLTFGGVAAPAPFPSALVCFGLNEGLRTAVQRALPDAWHIPRVWPAAA